MAEEKEKTVQTNKHLKDQIDRTKAENLDLQDAVEFEASSHLDEKQTEAYLEASDNGLQDEIVNDVVEDEQLQEFIGLLKQLKMEKLDTKPFVTNIDSFIALAKLGEKGLEALEALGRQCGFEKDDKISPSKFASFLIEKYHKSSSKDATCEKAWKKSIQLWYTHEQKFKDEMDLLEELSFGGVSTVGESREALIYHLLNRAQGLDESSIRSPPSNVISGVAGIGKTLVQIEVGQRIPKRYPSICVAYLDVGGLTNSEMDIDISEIVEYCKEKSKKEKCLVLLDDTEAVFFPANDAGSNFVTSLGRVCPPNYANVVVQLFGSSQVLTNLIQRNMDETIAFKLGYKGYVKSTRALDESKLPVFYPYSPGSWEELNELSRSIASQLGKACTVDDKVPLTWYCSGIARKIQEYLQEIRTARELLPTVWAKVRHDTESLEYYHEIVSSMNLVDRIKNWTKLQLFVQENDMFKFMEEAGKKIQCGELENELSLLAKGNVKRVGNFIVPTFPICVLMECVRINSKEDLFKEGQLMPPYLTRRDIEKKIDEAKEQQLGTITVQSYQLFAYQFSKLSGLPNLEQLYLALAKSPDVLPKGKAHSQFHGIFCIDLLNFGVINAKIGMEEADQVIGDFGKAYFNLCKEIAGDANNSIEYCGAFHRSGDEFGVLCLFDNLRDFEMVAGKLAHIKFSKNVIKLNDATKSSKSNDANDAKTATKVTAYGRVGGYYRNISQSMRESFRVASWVESSIKDKVAVHFGFADAVAMKNKIKRPDGPVIIVKDEDLDILWKIQDDELLAKARKGGK